MLVTRENAHTYGVGEILDRCATSTSIRTRNSAVKPSLSRVMVELVTKMQEMTMDKTELGCLRAIVLFNPDVKGLKEISR